MDETVTLVRGCHYGPVPIELLAVDDSPYSLPEGSEVWVIIKRTSDRRNDNNTALIRKRVDLTLELTEEETTLPLGRHMIGFTIVLPNGRRVPVLQQYCFVIDNIDDV